MSSNKVTHKHRLSYAVFVFLAYCPFAAGGDTVVVLEYANRDTSGAHRTELLISEHYILTLDDSKQAVSRYSTAEKTLLVFDHKQQSYSTLNKELATTAAAQIKAQLAALMAKLNALPPQQRQDALEELQKLLGHNPSEVAVETEFRATQDSDYFAKLPCNWYEYDKVASSARSMPGRACLTDPETLPGGGQLLAMLQSLSEIYGILLAERHPQLNLPIPSNPMAPMSQLGKIPLRIIEGRANAKPMLDVELLSVSEAEYQASLFALPESYQAMN